MMSLAPHQYIDRATGRVETETLFADRLVNTLYAADREQPTRLFTLLTSARVSSVLGWVAYDAAIGSRLARAGRFYRDLGINLDECLDPPHALDTARKVFERKIRYWEARPMPDDPDAVVSPADARVLVGSFSRISQFFIKEKFFTYAELIGAHKPEWLAAFRDGDVAVFRLTPDKYHYNHTPVAGRVLDFYEIAGEYRPCNPGAIMSTRASFSKNRRVVTVIDTDVPGGTGVGRVAVIEVAALMIGDIVQCYSEDRYDNPREVTPGIFLKKGMPKSLYRPGSSTDILIFQKGRVTFSEDILYNLHRTDAATRFSEGFGRPLVETEVRVRQEIARRNPRNFDSQAKETGA
ncbi:phosphatidylserine decarboxylase [Desulfococcus sp.]|uniref:phosphatidylserine decarboxylase n=1 Tax=Desulfococcus sp. TaxID=2025834 RepID=UPI0035936A62